MARYPVPGGEPSLSPNIPSGPALEAFLRGLEPPPPEPVDYSPLGSVTSPRTERVLIVDDDPDIARFIEVNLRSVGFADTVSVGDGLEALARAQGLRPDLILTDVNRPRMDGFSFVQALRQMTATARCAIVFLTAKAGPIAKATGLSLGADDYMIKPFDPIELLARVNSALRRTAQRRADQVGPSRVIPPLDGSEARSSPAADYLSSGFGLELEAAKKKDDPHIANSPPFLYELGERAMNHLYEEARLATDPSCTALLLAVRAGLP